ncbi:MAG: response regulator, partial [Pseudomonadota bacterium]
MSNEAQKEFQEKMRLLTASFTEELPNKISEIETLWSKLQAEWDMEALQKLHRSVHNLVGTGKTFGFPELSVEARTLEQILKNLMQKEVTADDLQSAMILQQVSELRRISVETGPKPTEDIIPAASNENVFLPDSHTSNLVFVVDDDVEAAQELALQLRYYGYEVEVFNHLDKFREAIKHKPNAIILMATEFPDDTMGGIHVMKETQRELNQSARVIFISSHDDLTYRLGAVRAGGIAYFTKPINSTELIDQIDLITASQTQESFRVLIVDDSSTVLFYHAAILEQAGITVKTISEPLN